MKKHNIPKDILERVEDELLVDEQLLWVGLPGKQAATMDIAMKLTILGLVIMLGLGLMAFLLVSGDTGSSWTPVSIVPAIFIIAAAAIAVTRAQQNQSRADLYAVTNRRAIILRKKSVQSFSSEDLRFIERKMHRDGTGDIIFNREYYQRMTMAGTTPVQTNETQELGFFGIENPLEVEALMLETFRSKEPKKHRLLDEESDSYYNDYQDEFRQAKQS